MDKETKSEYRSKQNQKIESGKSEYRRTENQSIKRKIRIKNGKPEYKTENQNIERKIRI